MSGLAIVVFLTKRARVFFFLTKIAKQNHCFSLSALIIIRSCRVSSKKTQKAVRLSVCLRSLSFYLRGSFIVLLSDPQIFFSSLCTSIRLLCLLLFQIDRHVTARPDFFLWSSRIRVDLLSCKSKPTEKRTEGRIKKLDGYYSYVRKSRHSECPCYACYNYRVVRRESTEIPKTHSVDTQNRRNFYVGRLGKIYYYKDPGLNSS